MRELGLDGRGRRRRQPDRPLGGRQRHAGRSSARTSTPSRRGGRFDGALGVVAALHAVALLQQEGFEPSRPIWIVAFMDEEGTRFDAALFGSRAFAGEDVARPRRRAPTPPARRCATRWRARVATSTAPAEAQRHRRASAPTSSCTSSRARCSRRRASRSASSPRSSGCAATACGCAAQANHAGTTPMAAAPRRARRRGADRARAARAALARATAMTRERRQDRGRSRAARTSSPAPADFTIDVRAATPRGRGGARARWSSETVRASPTRSGSRPSSSRRFALEPLELDPELVDTVERAAAAEGATSRRMPSGAGHDAMVIGRHVPGRDDLRPEPRRDQPFARGVQRRRTRSSWGCASWRRPFAPSSRVGDRMRVVGVDIGGTFTDFMLYDTESGVGARPQGALDAGRARARDGRRARRALRAGRPRAVAT